MIDHLVLNIEKTIRVKNSIERACHIKLEIESTDDGCLEKCISDILRMDKTGELRRVFERALLRTSLKEN